ncbi:MAG: M24 family metallopeptidase, partial [Spirochaetota bacterium]
HDETPLTEYSLGEKLLDFRKKAPHCIGESFAPIAGFKDHGAIVHYSAKPETSYTLEGNGLLILDSGGQYEGGTTDVTRTLLFGEPTQEHIRDYTLVLKAHLSLARQKFPAGTYGYQLDGASRLVLWNAEVHYGHGTGHGVGHMLNVHEGPQNISPKPITTALRPGMVLSNEPGVYRSGKHGIRIENLLVVSEGESNEFGAFYQFENLTLCPYERRLIDVSLLNREEIKQINSYHQLVYQHLYPRLSKEAAEWLQTKTHPLA